MKFKRIPRMGLVGAVIGMWVFIGNTFLMHNLILYFGVVALCWIIGEIIGIVLVAILPKTYTQLIDYSYWGFFNFIGRFLGIMAIIVGLGFLGSVWHLFPNKNYTYTIEEQIGFYVVAVFLFIIGIASLVVKEYYPKGHIPTHFKEDKKK